MVVVDTNLWVYLFTNQDFQKQLIVKEILKSFSPNREILISTQIYKEIARVLKDKIKLSTEETLEILSAIEKLTLIYPEMPVDIKTALDIRQKYRLQFFDSVIIAFCLRKGVKVLLTEDISIPEVKYQNKELRLINPLK
ncbi:PIN domain-containing protein [Persephonella sp. KM09-Lau-8]|uniref:PIN domain-containing protein n=1 Tax=Persephonella sp. KM09-Lau-8 TaxID=1158345 RepID=UPI000498457F|nr:PIN domain-containing protein [Persephonella sp. KM09-Lau-8]